VTGFLIIIVAFAFLWLVLVRPQKRRQVQQRKMLSELRPGQEVLTAGGIYGRVTRLAEEEVTVEIAPELEIRVARRAIAAVTPPDELEGETVPEPESAPEPDTAPDEDRG